VTAALVACQTKPTLTLSLVRPSFFSVCFACLWSAGLLEIETDSESGEGRGGGDEARKNSCSLCRKSSTQTEQLLLEILVRKPVCPPTNHARPADPAGKGGVRGGRWQLPPKVFIFAAPPGGLWGGRVGGQCWSPPERAPSAGRIVGKPAAPFQYAARLLGHQASCYASHIISGSCSSMETPIKSLILSPSKLFSLEGPYKVV